MLTLGIDIGTTSICGVLYDTQIRSVKKAITRANDSMISEEGGCYLQDSERILSIVYELMENLQEGVLIEALGVTGQMHGILYTDAEGRAVSPLITWKDSRGNDVFQAGKSYARYLSEETGYAFYAGYGLVSHFYYQKKGLISQKAEKLMTIADYVALNLAGAKACKMEASMAASLGGFCLKKGSFDEKALQKAGVDISYLPQVLRDGEPACLGTYGEIPVYAACGDNQASFLAAVGRQEEGICVNVGTGSQVSAFYKEAIPAEGMELRPFFQKGFLYVGASLNGGKAYALLGEFYKEICECFTGMRVEPYEIMNHMAQSCEDTGGLTVEPLFYGARGNSGHLGTVKGMSPDNFHVPEFTRAFVTGMVRELYERYLSFPQEVRRGRNCIYGGGNGMRKNELLRSEVERIFQMPVEMSPNKEEAAAGAALAAFYYTQTP